MGVLISFTVIVNGLFAESATSVFRVWCAGARNLKERRGWHIAWSKLASQVSAIVGTYKLHSILTAPAICHLCELGNGLEIDGGRRVANCSIKND